MPPEREELQELAENLKAARRATAELTAQLRKLGQGGRELRSRMVAACTGGVCAAEGASQAPSGGTRRDSGLASALSTGLSRSLSTALRGALSGDWQRVLRNVLAGFTRSLGSLVARRAGGGLFGGLLGSLVGGGLDLLLGRLFRRRQAVKVENVVRAEVLNFPRLSDLSFATNPASRLFGGRAVARGPAFTVTVDYRSGAEEVVTAKVAAKLAELNHLQGMQ